MRILPKNKWARRFVKWLVIPVGGIVLLLAAGWAVLSIVGSVQLKNAIAESRAMGGSVTWEDVAAKIPKTATQEEGTRLFREAFEELGGIPNDVDDNLNPIEGIADLPLGQLMTQAMAAAVEKRVRDTQPVREKLGKVVSLGAYLWTPGTGAEGGSPEYFGQYRQGCRLFALAALHDGNAGNGDAAIGDISTGLEFPATLNSDPTILARLVEFACQDLAVRTLPFVLAVSDPSPEALKQLDAKLAARKISFKNALDADSFAVLANKNIESGGEALDPTKRYGPLGPGPFSAPLSKREIWLSRMHRLAKPWLQMSEAHQIRMVNQVISNWDKDWDGFSKFYDAIPRRSSALRFAPLYDDFKRIELRQQAQLQRARAAIAVELYRRANGKPGDLVPGFMAEAPKDPLGVGEMAFTLKEGVLIIGYASAPGEEFKVYPKVKR